MRDNHSVHVEFIDTNEDGTVRFPENPVRDAVFFLRDELEAKNLFYLLSRCADQSKMQRISRLEGWDTAEEFVW